MKIRIKNSNISREVSHFLMNSVIEEFPVVPKMGDSVIQNKKSWLPKTAVDVDGTVYLIWFRKYLKLSLYNGKYWIELENFIPYK